MKKQIFEFFRIIFCPYAFLNKSLTIALPGLVSKVSQDVSAMLIPLYAIFLQERGRGKMTSRLIEII
jgi:hypothetical protein